VKTSQQSSWIFVMGKDNKYKNKFKGSTWNKKRKSEDSDWDRDNRTDFVDNDGSGGSYPMEEVKAMEEYQRRISHDNAPKRKYALAFSYCGTSYQGLQINPGAITVEGFLERALFLAGGIQESNYGTLQKIAWTRAARTDRGVHAIGQCCSMKLTMPEGYEKQFISDLNTFLPPDIRAVTLTRTTRSFNARGHCSHRRYQFLLPTYLFTALGQVNDMLTAQLQAQGRVVDAGRDGSFAPPNSTQYVGRPGLSIIRATLLSHRATADELAVFRAAMKRYEGTHNYHNFTSSKVVTAAGSTTTDSMQRYMMDINVSDPFLVTTRGEEASEECGQEAGEEESEWVRVTLLGQSFLLNQVQHCSATQA
jgi:tRNA pseudouridine38-40 synthase